MINKKKYYNTFVFLLYIMCTLFVYSLVMGVRVCIYIYIYIYIQYRHKVYIYIYIYIYVVFIYRSNL